MDADLATFWKTDKYFETIDRRVLLLAVEYRNIANSYLSRIKQEVSLTILQTCLQEMK